MAKPGPTPTVTPDDILDVFAAREDPTEPLTAPEIADALGCSRSTALDKLHRLRERGDVASKKVGGRSRVWWVPPDAAGKTVESAADRVGGRGLFTGEDGEAFAEAVEASREKFDEDYEERQRDLFGQ
jgi:predicted ArsR family transcriptional regulator